MYVCTHPRNGFTRCVAFNIRRYYIMKMFACLNIADGCGLQTVAEAIRNIRLHANWIFDYDNLWEELAELDDEFFDYDLDYVDSIATALEKINKKDNTNLKFG